MIRSGGKRKNTSGKVDPGPLVSIIVVTFNAGRYLQRCLNSIKNQPRQDVEVLIFDGASTDDTVSIILANEEMISYWQSEPDGGIYNAMNKAVEHVNGKWVLFLGADDELLPGFSDMFPFLKDQQTIYYGDFIKDESVCGGEFNAYRLAKSNLCHQNIFYPTTVFDKYRYEERFRISADHYLNMQCWSDPTFRFEYHPFPIAHFSTGGISSHETDWEVEKERIKNIRKYLGVFVLMRYRLRQFKLAVKKMLFVSKTKNLI